MGNLSCVHTHHVRTCAHTQVNTNVQQASASEFYLTLDEVESINHVVVFLTGQVPFAEGFGGSIYFGWPVGKSPVVRT